MKILGRHLIAEFVGCRHDLLDDQQGLEAAMKEAVRVSGATIVNSVFHRFNPKGVSGVVVIAESHISIHTWPEYGYAAVDFFTCGDSVNPHLACDYMKTYLHASDATTVSEIPRGIPSETDEILAHKPLAALAGR